MRLAVALFAAGLLVGFWPAEGWGDDPPPATVTVTVELDRLYQGRNVTWWARKAVQARKDANARGRTNKRLKRRWWPTVDYAYRLASVVYGVSYWELRAVGRCESGHNPGARNGAYRGVMQEGPMFERGPFGRAGFSVWDAIANVFTAAYTVRREGWRQWECKP